MTERANLYVDQNIDYVTTLNLFTNDGDEFDITNQVFSCDVRKIYSTEVLFSATMVPEPNNLSGVLELRIAAAQTINLKPGKYQYDVVMRTNGGTRQKILEGLMFILPTVSRGNSS